MAEHVKLCAWCGKLGNTEHAGEIIDPQTTEFEGKAVTHGICPECDRKRREEMKQMYGEDWQERLAARRQQLQGK